MDIKIKEFISNSLNSVNNETRQKFFKLAEDPIFTPLYDISIRNQKELAQKRLKIISSSNLVSVKDFLTNPENIFTMHELLTYLDGSLATKFTVQFNLFGGTIIGLGTDKHQKYIDGIDSLDITGCFCLTELGYGNNAIEMETTSEYDEINKQFTIDTKTINSQKYWITNGAYYANYAIVFAQTIVKGKNEGINAFIIRLRDENGKLCNGVTIDDMGHKMGLNGVDNARIILKNIKVDKNDLLNRISDIDDKGNFVSKISGRRQRFLAAADRLLSGRLCIGSMMISATKLSLLITNKYASVRLSNGKTGKSDTPISNFQLFQNQIVPLIVKTYIYNIGLLSIRKLYSDYMVNPNKYDENYFKNLIRLVCVIKPIIAWHSNTTGNICRERCGGQGYLSINRLDACISGGHSGMTAEGDSAVLMQKVSKEYVEDYLKKVLDAPAINQSQDSISKKNNIFDYETLISLIRLREGILLSILAEKTMNNMANIYESWMMQESDLIQDLAMMFGERFCLEETFKNYGKNNHIVDDMIILYAAQMVRKNLAWYLINHHISHEAANKLDNQINDLIKDIGKNSLEICESFGIPSHVVFAPIYSGYQEYYKSDITNGEHYDVKMKPKF